MDILLLYKISSLCNALVATILSFVVYFRNRKELINKLFSLFLAFVAVWSYAYFFWFSVKNYDIAFFDFRFFLMGFAIFIPILFFHSTLVLTNKVTEYKIFLKIGYITFLFFLLANYSTPLFIRSFRKYLFFEFWPESGILFHPYILIWYFYFAMTLYILIKKIKLLESNNSYKTQLKYLVFGGIIGFAGSVPNNLFWYDWYSKYIIFIAPFTNFLGAIGMTIIAYAIIKHHLFDIKVLISELLLFIIWVFEIIRIILSTSEQELFINSSLAILVFIAGILLLRSVSKETELAKKLLEEAKKNLNLEQQLRKKFTQKTGEIIKKMEDIVQD